MKGKRVIINLDAYEHEAIQRALKRWPKLENIEGAIHAALYNMIQVWEGRSRVV
jgi:hypothetical protein